MIRVTIAATKLQDTARTNIRRRGVILLESLSGMLAINRRTYSNLQTC